MDRRNFICCSAGLVTAAAGSMLSPQSLHARSQSTNSIHLYRFDSERQCFVTLAEAIPAPLPVAPEALRLSLDGFHPAASGGVRSLDIQAAFDRGGGERWRFFAWHYRSDDRHGSSRASGFDLASNSRCRLEFTLSAEPLTSSCMQTLNLDSSAGIEPGRYVAVIAPGRSPEPLLAFSGDWRKPLADGAAFDYLSLRLEVQEAAVDLAARADLACVDACQESA